MELYNEIISRLRSLLPEEPSERSPFYESGCAPDGEKDSILFRSETAFELGGGGKGSAEAVVFSDSIDLKNETLLFGPDLKDIRSDHPFGHFTVVKLKKDEEEINSEMLKEIGFTVFRLYPEGYHIRISPSSSREQVRVAKSVLEGDKPLSFINVGNSLIREFLRNDEVECVKTVFVTDPGVDFKALSLLAGKAKRITDAVQSTLQLDELDCASCKMKPICDEIDGLRELHFKKEGNK